MSSEGLFDTSLVETADEHRLLRESLNRLVSKFGRRYYQDVVASGRQPDELWRALGAAGFLGLHIPEAYGGGGGGLAELNIAIEETAAQGCPLLSMVISAIVAPIIASVGTEELKREWLGGLASGERRMSFAITEPNAGSNTHLVTTSARNRGDGWILKGVKYWTSGVDHADAVMVVARHGELDHLTGRTPLSLFIVPTDARGLTMQRIDAAVRTPEKQFSVFFDDVELGPQALVGRPGTGLRQVFLGLNPERIAAAAINNGIARFAIARAAEYARTRKVWEVPIGAHQGLAHPLAESYIGVQTARLMTARAAELHDRGHNAAEAANMAKFAAADASLKALDCAIQVHGGNGYSYEYGLADLWFVARLHKTAPLSREMILNFVSQHSLGLPKSY